MGNKPTCVDLRHVDIYSAHGRNIRSRLSDENYLPMPLTMKKALVEGKRYRHVKPSVEEAGEREKDVGMVMEEERYKSSGVLRKSNDGIVMGTIESDSSVEVLRRESHVEFKEPIVTVVNVTALENKSTSQTNLPLYKRKSFCNVEDVSENTKHPNKSPTMTNRRYSLIDMKTGVKKSKFTLELEEKLRQSKFSLGFDDDLNDWKEFSYRMENPECSKKVESLKKGQLRFGLEGTVGKGLEQVCLRDPLQYCAHNCQILGLCSVRNPDVLPKNGQLDSLAVTDEIGATYNEVQSILKGNTKHHQREDCNCDHCTLAYLTEMGFPEDNSNRQCVSDRKGRSSPKESPKSCRKRVKERIGFRIVENENTRKSIEISVSARSSTVNSVSQTLGDNSSQSGVSSETIFDEDTTNRRIKKMFRKNNAAAKDVSSNRNENQHTLVVNNADDIYKTSGCFNNRSEDILQVQVGRPPSTRRRHGSNGRRSSSSTLGLSVSSSLSSVLSYKRVRQIFQSIIERNRARRRPKKNVNKFRELEELGLGEVKNNRWYPSDSKTVSIWHGMHQSVQGIQGEFKKYPRTYLKRLD